MSREKAANGLKPSYSKPKLQKHGNLAKVTKAKAGTKTDGAGKPATRANGPSA